METGRGDALSFPGQYKDVGSEKTWSCEGAEHNLDAEDEGGQYQKPGTIGGQSYSWSLEPFGNFPKPIGVFYHLQVWEFKCPVTSTN